LVVEIKPDTHFDIVIAGLDPAIHAPPREEWVAGSSPAMTVWRRAKAAGRRRLW